MAKRPCARRRSCIALGGSMTSTVVTRQPGPVDGVDVWLTSYYSYDDDYGGDNDLLRVGGWADTYEALIKFDLSDLPQTRGHAVPEPHATNNPANPAAIVVERVGQDWDESIGWYNGK